MHCRSSSSWVIAGLSTLCLLTTGVLGDDDYDYDPGDQADERADLPVSSKIYQAGERADLPVSSEIAENATLPAGASEMKEESTLAVKPDGTSLSSPTPVEKTSIRDHKRTRTATRKKVVRRRTLDEPLSAGEQRYIVEREKIVREALNNLKIRCSALESVPRVALLGSGGGERAAASMMGSLSQMQTDGLLDTLLYLGGLSGSAWAMMSLYSDPAWSIKDMSGAVSSLWGPPVGLEEAIPWLAKRSQAEDFSLTDLWAVMTSATVTKKMDLRRISQEAGRVGIESGLNPYPVYSAINKNCKHAGPLGFKGTWFELTPHESGYTELGLFFNTSLLGSRLHEDNPESEMTMLKFQGILTSAVADEQAFTRFMPDELKDAVGRTLTNEDNLMDLVQLWMDAPRQIDNAWDAANVYMRIQHTIAKLPVIMNKTTDDPTVHSQLDNSMEEAFKELREVKPVALLENEKRSPEQRKKLYDSWSAAIIQPMEEWSQSLEPGPLKDFVNWKVKTLLPAIGRWEWGTTENLLYREYSTPMPPCVRNNKRIQLIDAWSALHMPYPPFLGHERDIDLIIAMDYTAGEAFMSLIEARDYAAKVNKPFPEIDERILEEKDWPNDIYVFQGDQDKHEPTIIYMPLFNRKNCEDAEEVNQRLEEYSAFHLPFNQEQVEFLVETAAANMEHSKDSILTELQRAVERKAYRA